MGTISEVLQAIPLPDSSLRVALRGVQRGSVSKIYSKGGCFWAQVDPVLEPPAAGIETEALIRTAVEAFTKVVQLDSAVPPESLQGIGQLDHPGHLADTIIHHLPLRTKEKQALLEDVDPSHRLETLISLLHREEQVLGLGKRIHERVEKELGDSQREFYLREQLRIIQDELREREDRVGETEEYRAKIFAVGMSDDARDKALSELRRLDRTPAATPEGLVIRTYLDTLIALPWSVTTEDRLDVEAASRLLNEHHFGLNQVKDRILDYLAVRQLRGTLRGPILCFLGPPGVGKTSICRSIAEAMGRRFLRIALGGGRDEADIRGHRRTYVGSMPGRIMQGLCDCGSRNPVIVLDEVDKLSSGPNGDPMSALLEALDPEQNDRFVDHYVEAPFDLGSVMFITTANLAENIPAPLRDRMEFIPFPGYTDHERIEIARQFLEPRAITESGLPDGAITIPEATLRSLVFEYTREAGVRGLDRHLQTVCRKVARRFAEGDTSPVEVDAARLRDYLGRPRFARRAADARDEVGTAWSMVVSESGGELLKLETSLTDLLGPRPDLLLTGNLGDVMRESAQAALTYIRANIQTIAPGMPIAVDTHIHMPDGAVPKDGPSAGLTVAVALASSFSGRPIRGGVAITGEITLRGRVHAVGGIREKVLAAIRAGLTDVILPAENEPDIEDVPEDVLEKLQVHYVNSINEAIAIALTP
jgi:ATP-dependent Lon protease